MSNEKVKQNKELVEKLERDLKHYKETGQYDKAVQVCETLVFEYEYFGYRFELPRIYNRSKQYSKTIGFVNSWMADEECNDILKFDSMPVIELAKAYAAEGLIERAIKNLNIVISI